MSETIHLPVDDTGGGFTRYKKADTVERGFQRRVTVVTSDRAIKGFEMTDTWPFKERPGVWWSRGRSQWSILPGTRAPEHFMWNGSHSRSWDIFPGAGVRATQNFAGIASIPGMEIRSPSPSNMPKVESKSSGHFIPLKAPAEANTFPDSRVGV